MRLRAGWAAKHWRQSADGDWDAGYQKTGYFLEFLEKRFGEGTVRRMNAQLREEEYEEDKLFTECCDGQKVGELWKQYGEELKKKNANEEEKEDKEPPDPIPTHTALKP